MFTPVHTICIKVVLDTCASIYFKAQLHSYIAARDISHNQIGERKLGDLASHQKCAVTLKYSD